ncbi:unnamed protein product [Darwinula stevensoni]|uniref:Diaminopimelate decarboxylase n=1 Tax=Darwinula stevensoni TaxID=69355 RepID=A0A7R9A887_9CRUS|nr:unnamed protein product [Darwinula stevensoni]CAG0896168.1 unnamed protein product [Darwinula stevensoni]
MLDYVGGVLHCDGMDLVTLTSDLGAKGITTPYFLYSEGQIRDNANGYLSEIPSDLRDRIVVGYALKANPNPEILGVLRRAGMGAETVSGSEVRLARREGFPPLLIMYNGNGKEIWEILYAVKEGCLMNIDSLFDAARIARACDELATPASLLLRVKANLPQPDSVHSHGTAAGSKCGVELDDVEEVIPPLLARWAMRRRKIPRKKNFPLQSRSIQILELIKRHPLMNLVGLHSHLGSTITDPSTLVENFRFLAGLGEKLRADGWTNLDTLNLGGGPAIDYRRDGSTHAPPPCDLMRHVVSALREAAFPWRLWLEPGRSIVGNAAVLVTRVLGTKGNAKRKQFLVADAAMTDFLRPCLPGTYHHISPVVQSRHEKHPRINVQILIFFLTKHRPSQESDEMDVVGGVCESSDAMGRNRRLPRSLPEGSLLAVWDAGAYGIVFGSNYNLRPRPAEVMVSGRGWKVIRRRETFDDLVRLYDKCD